MTEYYRPGKIKNYLNHSKIVWDVGIIELLKTF